MIEVYKHQFKDISSVIAQIKNRNYKYILYMDDLSFEDFEIEYKYLKAIIEGGLETKPDNVVIYGHNLRTGGMFNKLTKYREESFWKEHQTFTFDTLYERHTYQIFAVFKTAARQYKDDGTPWGYPYHRMNEFTTRDAFNKFIADIKGAAFTSGGYQGWTFYDTGITPEYGDKLLCLSTCEYTMRDPDGTINGRLVVFAVRVD